MPTVEASEQFEISASPASCWSFFSDLSNIGSCIPGCEQVTKIDERSAEFRVKVKIGYLSKTFVMKARFLNVNAPSDLTFFAEGPDAEISGSVEIGAAGVNNSKIRYKIEIKAISVVGKTAVAMLGKEIVKKQASEFASAVKARLEV